jgi:hypothetical protein
MATETIDPQYLDEQEQIFEMRRFINLNQPGIMFVKVIGLFLVLIPVVLYGILLASRTGSVGALLLILIHGSFGIGAMVFAVFLALILAEQVQDHFLDIQYQKQRGQKIVLATGQYECQYCGNRRVQANDKTCAVCGKAFGLGEGSK